MHITHHTVIKQNTPNNNILQMSERGGLGKHEQILHLKVPLDNHSTIHVTYFPVLPLYTDPVINL